MKIINYILYLTLFMLPFYKSSVSWEIGVITFNPYFIGICILLILSIIQNIFTIKKYGFNPIDIFILLFCLCFFISTLLSSNTFKSGSMAFRWIFIPVASYFVLKTIICTEKQLQRSIFSILSGSVIFCLLGIVEVGITNKRFLILSLPPISAASIAIFVLIFIIYFGWVKHKVGFFCFMISLILLALTYSRIYLLMFILSPFIFYIIKKGHIVKLFIILFPMSLILSLALSVNPRYFTPRFVHAHESHDISRIIDFKMYKKALYNRAKQYKSALNSFLKHPVLGKGMIPGKSNVTVHNFHFEWLEYGGVLGYLFAFLIFAAYFLKQKNYVVTNRFSAVNLATLTIILINCLFNGIMHGIMPYLVFILIGLGEANKKILKSNPVLVS